MGGSARSIHGGLERASGGGSQVAASLASGRFGESFANQPDTDWTQAEHRARLESVEACQESPPRSGIPEIEEALAGTAAAQPHWEARGEGERAGILRACAEQLASTRFESIALMREEGKKAVAEVDPEVSEAIDFARYYAATGKLSPGTVARARGVVVVAPPWNFPLAIPCGGVLAALMAGNAVILKPAPETVRLGWWLVRQLWEAGVPREVLAFVACEDGAVGRRLIEDSRCLAVILTGAYETAQKFREWRPSLPLFAETSGKNALVVSATADREEAVRDLVKSAFGHAGQKCSAASLGILESEVYQDPVFRRQLRDVAASLWVGEARDPRSVVTPLIRPPDEKLRRALTTLDDGEEWLLQPEVSSQNACLWSPGIKLGVRPGSWFHHTECFGPVLGLMESADLEEALVLQNAVSFGLTAGLQALDEREISGWKARVEAGNLYINRPITGAIVQRQSFGGWKRSAVGPGAKAGGPNYVSLFRRFEDRIGPSERESVLESYRDAWNQHFSREHDPTGLISERNVFRYRPAKGVLLRLERKESLMEEIAGMAAEICGGTAGNQPRRGGAGRRSRGSFAGPGGENRIPSNAGGGAGRRCADSRGQDRCELDRCALEPQRAGGVDAVDARTGDQRDAPSPWQSHGVNGEITVSVIPGPQALPRSRIAAYRWYRLTGPGWPENASSEWARPAIPDR